MRGVSSLCAGRFFVSLFFSPASMRKRLDTAKVELEHSKIPGFFDSVVVSGDREETYKEFKAAMETSQQQSKV